MTFGTLLKALPMFEPGMDEGQRRYADLKKRVVEHNIRVLAKYYTRVSLTRLAQLLELTPEQAEDTLSQLVVSKTVYARIDRPADIITFRPRKDPNAVLQDWSSSVTYVDTWLHIVQQIFSPFEFVTVVCC